MKRFLLLPALLLAAAAVSASDPFEGVAEFKIVTGGPQGTTTPGSGEIFVAPAGYRMEFAMTAATRAPEHPDASGAPPPRISMTMIGRAAEPGKVFLLSDEKKTYFVLDPKRAAEHAAQEPFTVQKLGRDTVAGVSCEKVLLTSSRGSEIEICVASDLAISTDWLGGLNRRQADPDSWFAALAEQGIRGFPIRWAIRKKGSTEILASMEITRIEKKSLPASLFEVPASYSRAGSPTIGLSPESLEKMSPEQRKAYEDAMRLRHPTPTPPPPTPAP